MTRSRIFLVSYDIAEPRRWRRVFKLLRENGEHQQLSVFICRLPVARMKRLAARLAMLTDPAQDRLMVIELGTAADAARRIGGAQPAILRPPPHVVV